MSEIHAVDDRRQNERDFERLVEALEILMSWRAARGFRARVFHSLYGESEREYELEARPRELTYRLVEALTGRVDEFEGSNGRLVNGGHTVEYNVHMVKFEPLPVRLAFPMSLGIWGRPSDSYRIAGAAEEDDDIILTLVHMKDPKLVGSLAVSRKDRTAQRLNTPTESCRYEDVEPL